MTACLSSRAHEPPFFVVAAQRSGTTMLRLMLDHHPELAVPHEFDYVVEALPPAGGWPEPVAFEAVLERSGSFRRSGLRLDRELSFPDQAEDLLRQHQRGKTRVGMVVHAHFDRILRLWPDASFVHLLRDPRDVAASVIGMGWAGNVWHGLDRWIEAEQSWDRLKRKLASDRFTEIRYEALVADPEGELERLCTFLRVSYTASMLDYAEDTTYQKPDVSLAAQWRQRLSSREVQLAEARLGSWLTARGYGPGGLPSLRVGAMRRLLLRAHDWLARMRSRVIRYGPALVAGDILARKLRVTPWERRLRARIQAVSDRYVK